MINRYIILYRNFDSAFWDGSYKTQWLIPALFKFIKYRFKYDSVEFNYKNKIANG